MNIKEELERIYDNDQKLRKEWDNLSKKYNRESEEIKNHLNKITKNQKDNLIRIEKIIAKYGWPTKNEVGTKAIYAIWLVIQHSNKKTMLKYYKYIEKISQEGTISRSDFATFKDRLLILQGKKQIYGTQYIYDEKQKKYILEPIENINEANNLRKEVGLPPLKTIKKNRKKR